MGSRRTEPDSAMMDRLQAIEARGTDRSDDALVAARTLASEGGMTWERMSEGGRSRLIGIGRKVIDAVDRHRGG